MVLLFGIEGKSVLADKNDVYADAAKRRSNT
jgi:hypothetical protein